jgi:hypothetical protein
MIDRDWLTQEDGQREVTRIRDEATSKNPVRNRVRVDRIDLPPDLLAGVVASARDWFHTFAHATLGRRYKRPPIYLVDSMVMRALGAFAYGVPRRLPSALDLDGGDLRLDPSAPIGELRPALELCRALERVQGLLGGARILDIAEAGEYLEDRVLSVLEGKAGSEGLTRELRQMVNLVGMATEALREDLVIGPHVNDRFVDELHDSVESLARWASEVGEAPAPALPGTGFAPERNGGLLFGSIPELDIQGPAILLAPARILRWAEGFEDLRALCDGIPADSMESWFGVRRRGHRLGAVALAFVLYHEMTHAMLALPTDPVEDPTRMFLERWHFYDEHPEFEEGLCEATAVTATGVTLLKAMFGIRGRDLPRLVGSKYEGAWHDVSRWLRPAWQDYHPQGTSIWLDALAGNKFDFKAFSAVTGLYATNFGGFDWMQTFRAFQGGRIVTGR